MDLREKRVDFTKESLSKATLNLLKGIETDVMRTRKIVRERNSFVVDLEELVYLLKEDNNEKKARIYLAYITKR
jgi:hypothetical protein